MQPQTKRKMTWRDVADWALFFTFVQLGMIGGALLFGETHSVYSVEKFVIGIIVSVPIYLLMRRIKSGRFLLRLKQDE